MSSVKLSIFGDICPEWGFRASFDRQDVQAIFGDILSELEKSDLVVANFECPATNAKTPIVKCGPNLKAKPDDLEVLRQAGIHALAMANNHILDYGTEAVQVTIDKALSKGIAVYGAGKNATEAAMPCILERNGKLIGLMAFAEEEFNCAGENTAGANLFDPYVSLRQVERAKAQCDCLIVQYHGGIEYYRYPSPLLQKKCRAMVESGADLVLCQHSHCIGTYEKYHDATILYGQGNAIFGRIDGNEAWNTGLLVTVTLGEQPPSVSFEVFEAQQNGIAFVDKQKNLSRLRQMDEESRHLADPTFLKAQWNAFCNRHRSAYLPAVCCWNRVTNKANRILKNLLAKVWIPRKRQRVAMNLIRCDAHREVLQTILEEEVFHNS